MPVVNNLVFSVLLFQEHIGEWVFDAFDTNVTWLIWEGLEVWVDGVKVGKEGWKEAAEEGIELLGAPVKLESNPQGVARLTC